LGKIMDLRTSILVQILGDTDAVFIPMRTWTRPGPPNRYFARRDYLKQGVPWRSHGADESERKQIQRALDRLAKAGKVTVFRPRRGKVLGVRLTDASDLATRRLVGLPGLAAAWWSCRKLARHSRTPAAYLTDLYVPERKLIGEWEPERYRQEAVIVEDMLLCALVRGWVDSNADSQGRVSYTLTEAGRTWLDATPEPVDDDLPVNAVDQEAREVYDDMVKAGLIRLDTATPADPRELGMIPLPVACEGLRLDGGELQPLTDDLKTTRNGAQDM